MEVSELVRSLLEKRGMLFQRSYVQQALCSPSRISMLSGRYPATTGIYAPRRPEETALYRIVQEHLETWLAAAREARTAQEQGQDDDEEDDELVHAP